MAGGKTPLPSRAKDALETLRPRVESAGDGDGEEDELSRERALAALVAETFDESEARETLELLELRGYVYEVNGRLRITEE